MPNKIKAYGFNIGPCEGSIPGVMGVAISETGILITGCVAESSLMLSVALSPSDCESDYVEAYGADVMFEYEYVGSIESITNPRPNQLNHPASKALAAYDNRRRNVSLYEDARPKLDHAVELVDNRPKHCGNCRYALTDHAWPNCSTPCVRHAPGLEGWPRIIAGKKPESSEWCGDHEFKDAGK